MSGEWCTTRLTVDLVAVTLCRLCRIGVSYSFQISRSVSPTFTVRALRRATCELRLRTGEPLKCPKKLTLISRPLPMLHGRLLPVEELLKLPQIGFLVWRQGALICWLHEESFVHFFWSNIIICPGRRREFYAERLRSARTVFVSRKLLSWNTGSSEVLREKNGSRSAPAISASLASVTSCALRCPALPHSVCNQWNTCRAGWAHDIDIRSNCTAQGFGGGSSLLSSRRGCTLQDRQNKSNVLRYQREWSFLSGRRTYSTRPQ